MPILALAKKSVSSRLRPTHQPRRAVRRPTRNSQSSSVAISLLSTWCHWMIQDFVLVWEHTTPKKVKFNLTQESSPIQTKLSKATH